MQFKNIYDTSVVPSCEETRCGFVIYFHPCNLFSSIMSWYIEGLNPRLYTTFYKQSPIQPPIYTQLPI